VILTSVSPFSGFLPTVTSAAKEDCGRLIEANADLSGLRGDGDRKRSA
jgi:hypothetical protein